jgi:soluble cytochrome b562
MNIPNLPTDNLYKFIAIFGLIIAVFSSYMLNKTPEDILSKVDKIEAENLINKLKTQKDSTSVEMNKILIDVKIKQLSREVDNFPKLLYLYCFLLILGFTLKGIGFYNWYYKTQTYNDKILKNETEKILSEKSIHVHKVQFEKEFEVYKELWPNLIELRNQTYTLRPIFETINPNESEDESRNRKWKDFSNAFQNCVTQFDTNKPFYPENIYSEIEKVIRTSKTESIEFEFMPKTETDYYKNGQKNMDLIIEQIDKICQLIRERIGIMQVG